MEILVLWFICAIVCAIVAGTKDRSVVGWFFLGLFFGLLAAIIILCLSSKRSSMADVLAAQKLIEMAQDRPGSVDSGVLSQAHRTVASAK